VRIKSTKIRRILALAISHLPLGGLRRLGYELLLGYRFGAGTRIGWQVQIAVDSFEAGANVLIRRGTTFIGPIAIKLGDKVFIGRYNKIECGDGAAHENVRHMNYARRFIVGNDCLINESHLFDVLGEIRIGNGTWVAGFASQFLTHGAGTMNRDIVIGEGSFLGSAVRFSPGSGVASKVIVAMGAVVTKRIPEDNVIVGGVPARLIKVRPDDDMHTFTKTWEA
jgi:acetyltransferase-like isoleucine patch superfamily enzyme